jgi:hypothetical protein
MWGPKFKIQNSRGPKSRQKKVDGILGFGFYGWRFVGCIIRGQSPHDLIKENPQLEADLTGLKL